ncbi:MAG: MotB family protein [Roseibium sp.]
MMLEGVPNEIVIVRRKNSWEDDELPHGVWKIAYADFMTALMAFFLVMWLINVTDDSVRRGVAQYFNPVKLASTAPTRKGLNDPLVNGDTNQNGTKLFNGKLGGSDSPVDQDANFGNGLEEGHKKIEVEEKAAEGGATRSGQFKQVHAESILFTDPYAVLDTLSEQIRVASSEEVNPQGIGSGLQKQDGAQGGDAYRDPFDPLYWQFRPGRGVDGADTATTGLPSDGTGPDDGQGLSATELEGKFAWSAPFEKGNNQENKPAEDTSMSGNTTGLSQDSFTKNGQGPSDFAKSYNGKPADKPVSVNPIVAHVSGKNSSKHAEALKASKPAQVPASADLSSKQLIDSSKVEVLVTRLTEILKDANGTTLEETATQITVSLEGEGALISLTDDQNFGMFAIGSAEPRPELVKLLELLGKVIAKTPGQIVIKGHTDARPFKSKTYDNWRLSSARAHMALYMLSRGGVDKKRFDRVEGYADRHLKVSADPYAASNRRVEIYLIGGAE